MACSSSKPADRSGTFEGTAQQLGNGQVSTFVQLDRDGNPVALGLHLTRAALEGLPTADPGPHQPLTLELAFPAQAGATDFDHVMLNWNAQGHDPMALFGVPHFDFHFFMIDTAAQQAIDPADPGFATAAANAPAAQYVPQDYRQVPDSAVPYMGVHWADGSTPLVPGQFQFTRILINGSWNGKYTFVEPMVTRDYLLSKPDVSQDVKQPKAFQTSGYFPTHYELRTGADSYTVALTGLTHHDAS
ncbi:conserved hypothetical protein [Nocardia seriolae]|nr:conserved hypothetical protein [Nocardia seriolae]